MGDVIDKDTPADPQVYRKPMALLLSPGVAEVRYRPDPAQFDTTVTFNEYGEPVINLAVLTSVCQYAAQPIEEATAKDFKVGIGFGGYTDSKTGKKGLRIIATNLDTAAIHELTFDFAFEYETPLKKELERPGKEPTRLKKSVVASDSALRWAKRKGQLNPEIAGIPSS